MSHWSNLEELDLGWCLSRKYNRSTLNLTPQLLSECFARLPKLRKLFLSSFRQLRSETVARLAETCPDLEQLDLVGESWVDAEAVKVGILRFLRLNLRSGACCFSKSSKILGSSDKMPADAPPGHQLCPGDIEA